MGEHPNVTAMRELLDGFNSGDVEKIKAGLADDVKWHMIGGETVEGLEALAAAMGDMDNEFTITTETHDVVGNDDHVIAMVTAKVQAGDETFEYRTAEIAHVENGKITERWAFSDDTEAITKFFSRFS